MPKPLTQAQFKALQLKWYRKLNKAGFEDIEQPGPQERLARWDSQWFKSRGTPEQFAAKEAYYARARDMLNTYPFETKTQRNIWDLHAEGWDVRSIGRRVRKSKDHVAAVVRKLRKHVSSKL